MWAVSLIGRGTVSVAVWNGVPALSVDVPTSAAILMRALSRNSQGASTAYNGLRIVRFGRITAMSHAQAILSFSIGITKARLERRTDNPIMSVSSKELRTVSFIPWRVIRVTLADKIIMLSDTTKSSDTVRLPIKKGQKKTRGFIPLALLPYIVRSQ